jgi:hypothetical protein
MVRFQLGIALGLGMLIAALSSAAPGFNYPKCLTDNGAWCAKDTCNIFDEASRIRAAPPALGGQIEIIIYTQTTELWNCVQNAQQEQNTCNQEAYTRNCPGHRYVNSYPEDGQECLVLYNPPPGSILQDLGETNQPFKSCHQ